MLPTEKLIRKLKSLLRTMQEQIPEDEGAAAVQEGIVVMLRKVTKQLEHNVAEADENPLNRAVLMLTLALTMMLQGNTLQAARVTLVENRLKNAGNSLKAAGKLLTLGLDDDDVDEDDDEDLEDFEDDDTADDDAGDAHDKG